MRAILLSVELIVFILISVALIIGVSVGVGWLLALILPFSLFEGTVVSMLTGIAAWLLWSHILRTVPPSDVADEDDTGFEGIPITLFCEREADKTWDAWFRYVFANSIYEDLLNSPEWDETDTEELQDLAVRLADAAVGSLKKKSSRAKRMRINTDMLRQELIKAGHRSDDEDTLNLAMVAVNVELVHLEEALRLVIKDGLWAERVEMFQ